DGSEYAVIEVNPRVSRSSALASKATGYPIAKITTRLALGYRLSEIRHPQTGVSLQGFEPDVSYIVVKFPKWPFDKFASSSRKLGTQMKATGEVMSIGDTFEQALMKAVRGAEIGLDTLNAAPLSDAPLIERLKAQDDRRLFTVYEALKAGMSIEEIYEITMIDPYFLKKINHLLEIENRLTKEPLTEELVKTAQTYGYTAAAIRRLSSVSEVPRIPFSYRIVDTCSPVFGNEQPYFYSVVDEEDQAADFPKSGKPVIVVLGSGPIRIGQGIEFDYSSVHCVWTLQEMGYDVVIINNNPETVSTDYDTANRLYFEPLTPEDVMDILAIEKPVGVVVAFGGQTAINLTGYLNDHGVRILGTSAESIDIAEDRSRFDALLETFGIRRPKGLSVLGLQEAIEAAEELGYPVLLRPSYVIGGQNMTISRNREMTESYMEKILAGGIENPVLIDKYMPGIELEVDVISDGTDVLIPGIMEHVERAGVHSGDSIAVYPPFNLNDRFLKIICDCSEKLALALKTQGLVNIQYLIYDNELYVIEVNPRASRTVPYISKVTGVPMVDLAARVMLGGKLADLGYGTGLYRTPPYYAVKVPVFSFEKLNDANSILGPEMKSTGEVLGLGKTMAEALFKGLTASGLKVPEAGNDRANGIFLSVEESDYQEISGLAGRFYEQGFSLFATSGTAEAIKHLGIPVHVTANATESDEILELLDNREISCIIYTGAVKDATVGDYTVLHRKAMQAGVPCLTSLDTANALADIMESRYTADNTELVDINNMRKWRQKIRFQKMQSCGNDYIFVENFDGSITCPESLCVQLCTPHYGIGGDGIVLMENSDKADIRMRSFNKDGSEGQMAGNNIRCVAKYCYDRGLIRSEFMTVETGGQVYHLQVYLRDGKVSSVSVRLDGAVFTASELPVDTALLGFTGEEIVEFPAKIGQETYEITCLSVGNPHCVVFEDAIDALDLEELGPKFEYAPYFPERINTEFVRIVDASSIRVRVYERGNKETLACGTGALAAVAAGVKTGRLPEGRDIKVRLPGGDLTVNYTDERMILTGSAVTVFEGEFEY
ncbi:MAG: carbamoyl-phosphate synthase large subunit, partial [Lachnospiraceae bacterium]|nr:carbamoyl-phosphate synthase large subunit [Lachnospiraceae bacterium]